MKINKNSWHYKWGELPYRLSGNNVETINPPKTLCGYISWWLIFGPICFLGFCMLGLMVILIPVICLLGFLGLAGLLIFKEAYIAGIGTLLTFLFFFRVMYTSITRKPFMPKFLDRKIKGLSFFQVMKEYAKAKKQKICPLIEYVE